MQKEKVIVIGSGPAGLTAALYTARALLKPLVISGSELGGQISITSEVENYPGFPQGITGPELVDHMQKQAEAFGARIVIDEVTKVNFREGPPFSLKTHGDSFEAQAIIVCVGASPKRLGVPGEEEMIGRGVSFCATCDGFFFRDKEVVVVGGGDSAMEDAIYLTKFARAVVLIHRRDEFRASKIMQERALSNPKIRVLWNTVVTEVMGDDAITGLKLENTVDGQESEVEVAGLFVAIGHKPNTAFLKGQVELKDNGYIQLPVAWRTNTSVEGVFAAGDVFDDNYRQAVSAAGTGCMAALDAERWLAHGGPEHLRESREAGVAVGD